MIEAEKVIPGRSGLSKQATVAEESSELGSEEMVITLLGQRGRKGQEKERHGCVSPGRERVLAHPPEGCEARTLGMVPGGLNRLCSSFPGVWSVGRGGARQRRERHGGCLWGGSWR